MALRPGARGRARHAQIATRIRYPGEAATGEDAKLAIALMRRHRSALREFLGL